jgi:hypothetical protein
MAVRRCARVTQNTQEPLPQNWESKRLLFMVYQNAYQSMDATTNDATNGRAWVRSHDARQLLGVSGILNILAQ